MLKKGDQYKLALEKFTPPMKVEKRFCIFGWLQRRRDLK